MKASNCALMFASLHLWAALARAEDTPSLWRRETLLERGGARESLAGRGVEVSGTYTGEGFGVVSGGRERGAVYNGLLELGLDVDLAKLVGWRGAALHALGIYPHGAGGSERYAGDLGVFSNIEFYDSYRLFSLWFEQSAFAGRLSLRAGLLTLDDEYTGTDAGAIFINSSFGAAPALNGNFPVASYGISALGARLRIEPASGLHAMLAVYDGNPAPGVLGDFSPDAAGSNEFNHYGTHWALRRDEGAMLAAEIGFAFHQQNDPPEAEAGKTQAAKARALAGSYKAGAIYHTDTFADVFDATLASLDSSLAPARIREVKGNYALYAAGEQELWRERESDTDGVTVFARGVFVPEGRNFFDRSVEAGLVYRGFVQGGGGDALGLAVAWLGISERAAGAVRVANRRDGVRAPQPHDELIVELTWRFQIARWWAVQPDAQWIVHPGGSRALDDAFVLGLRSSITF